MWFSLTFILAAGHIVLEAWSCSDVLRGWRAISRDGMIMGDG